VSIEHRLLYDLSFCVNEEGAASTPESECPWTGRCVREGSDVTVIASSIMVLEALRAAEYSWSDSGVSVEVIDIESPSHFNHDLVLQSIGKTGRLVVADTSWAPFGLSAEIARIVLEESPSALREPMRTIGMKNAPCPTAKSLEDAFYPTIRDLVGAIYLVTGNSSEKLPESESFRDFYHSFRGPF
jgi:pyruvate dehydrogenase E1 component beta subunit